MDDKLASEIANAPKKILVEVVKLAQKQGRQGSEGSWKDFLNVHDRKLGSCLSDPGRRSQEMLVSFLQTFTDKEHLKFLTNILRSLSNRDALDQVLKESLDSESPEQRLVRLTLEHPLYLLKYAFPMYNKEDWVVTKVSEKSKLMSSNIMLALDCEMVLCEDGTDALVRVCVVDRNLQVKLDEKVNPCKPVLDYRTEITGVTAADLEGVSRSLEDIQRSMKKLLSKGTILVGHGLNNDLQVLKLEHARVIDTSFIFKTLDGRTPSLNALCKSILGFELRKEGAPHNCIDDACAAMKLVLAKIEHGVDHEFPLIQNNVKNVPEIDMSKLLLHKIPIKVPREELHGLFPGNFKIETKRAQGVQYSVIAIFKNPEKARRAFEKLDGSVEKDSSGRPQKLVTLQLKTGEIATLYVRKMADTHSLNQVLPKKRDFEGGDSSDPKKLKTENRDNHLKEMEKLKQELRERELKQCSDHLKEIERLKQELNAKDFEISTQDKIIMKLKKKLKEMKNKKKGR